MTQEIDRLQAAPAAGGARTQADDTAALRNLSRAVAADGGAPAHAVWATVTLLDGSRVRIRRLGRHDIDLQNDFIGRLSPRSTYLRFFGAVKPNDRMTRALTDIDYRKDMAFVALVHEEGEEREVGVSRYAVAPDGKSCECAIVIRDDWQGRGLAVILMRLLADVARRRGIESMIAIELRENASMRELADFLGFQPENDPNDPGSMVHRLHLQPPAARHARRGAPTRAS